MEIQRNTSKKEKLRPIFESSVFFKMMFENAAFTGIIVMDTAGNILDVNHGFNNCFGYSKEMLVGHNFDILFIDEDRKRNLPERELEGVKKHGSYNDENYLRRSDGSATWVHGESIHISDAKGQEFVLKIVQDINEEKILEHELKRVNEEQEKTILDHETFIYTASHDLQSPINNISGLVKALKENPLKDNLMLLTLIEQSVHRFKEKIRELSDVGREQEVARRNIQMVSFEAVLEDVLFDLRDEVRESEAVITADFSAVPAIGITKQKLRSILQNLLSNAIKYRHNSRLPLIHVSSYATDDHYVELRVEDNGIGIAQEDQAKVFEMYERIQYMKEGSGVGMAIVRRMVENLGGRIKLESKVGEGSIFSIYFPKISV